MSFEGKDEDDFSDFSGEEDEDQDNESGSGSGSFDDEDDDDDSDFDNSFAEPDSRQDKTSGGGGNLRVKEVENQPYDAKVDLEDSFSDESIDTNEDLGGGHEPKMRALDDNDNRGSDGEESGDSPPRGATSPGMGNLSETEEIPGSLGSEGKRNNDIPPQSSPASKSSDLDEEDLQEARKKNIAGVRLESQTEYMQEAQRRAAAKTKKSAIGSDDDDDDDEDDESSVSSSAASRNKATTQLVGGYNPEDYQHLDVSSEVKELFQYIGRYKPHDIELDAKLKCFIPDFIPAVGQIDTFVKIPHPVGEPDNLGLKRLDEPAAQQSDPTVLDLQLRAISKKSVKNPMIVRSIENASKDKKAIQSWIDSIKDLHRQKPRPQVHYTNQQPDIESLMQVWHPEFETLLGQVQLPSADIDLDLKDYARVVCALLDIPVYGSMIESLHLLFTLYTEFKDNQHFQRNPAVDGHNNNHEPQEQENFFSNE